MKRALCLILAVPIALLLGCGGDDDPASETPILSPTVEEPKALSKEDFITQGDAICAEVNAALGTLSETGTSSVAGQQADLYEGMIERLRALGKPSDDTGLDEFFTAGDDLVEAEKQAELATQRGDDTGLASAETDASAAQSEFESAASSYGFEDCGTGASVPTTTDTATAPVVPAAPAAPVAPAPAAPTAPAAPAAPAGGTGGPPTGGAGGGSSGSGGVGPG